MTYTTTDGHEAERYVRYGQNARTYRWRVRDGDGWRSATSAEARRLNQLHDERAAQLRADAQARGMSGQPIDHPSWRTP